MARRNIDVGHDSGSRCCWSPRQPHGQSEKVYEGEIADSQCALNVHSLSASHKEMIDMGSAGKTSTDCAHFCVKERGGKYVLQTKHEVYKLDRQDLAEKKRRTQSESSSARSIRRPTSSRCAPSNPCPRSEVECGYAVLGGSSRRPLQKHRSQRRQSQGMECSRPVCGRARTTSRPPSCPTFDPP